MVDGIGRTWNFTSDGFYFLTEASSSAESDDGEGGVEVGGQKRELETIENESVTREE